jgi:hypothetical protein
VAGELRATAAELASEAALAGKNVSKRMNDPATEAEWLENQSANATHSLIQAVGCAAAADALAERRPPAECAVPENGVLRQVAEDWASRARDVLPEVWAAAIANALASPKDISARVGTAVEQIEVPAKGQLWRRVLTPSQLAAKRSRQYAETANRALRDAVSQALAEPSRAVLHDRAELQRLLTGASEACAAVAAGKTA